MFANLCILKSEAEEFQKSGGDISLFWAGQMASSIKNLVNSPVLELGTKLNWLNKITDEYDKSILNRMKK